MPISFIHKHHHKRGGTDLFEPHLVCDRCGKQAEDGRCIVLWQFEPDQDHDGKQYRPVIVCQGQCHKEWEQHAKEFGRIPMWMRAGAFLTFLKRNLGGPPGFSAPMGESGTTDADLASPFWKELVGLIRTSKGLTAGKTDNVVYFIRNTGSGHIKIGTTKNVAKRLEALQTASPTKLEVVVTVPGDQTVEQAFHDRYDDARVQGEWFVPTPKLVSEMNALASSTKLD